MPKKEPTWNYLQLSKLVDKHILNRRQLAAALGLGELTFRAYYAGLVVPDARDIAKMSKFFDVHASYFYQGPRDEDEDRELQDNRDVGSAAEPDHVKPNDNDINKSIEEPRFPVVKRIPIPEGYLAPWPNNVVDEVLGDIDKKQPYDGIVTSDQLKGLDYVIEMRLDDRSRDMLLSYYRDGQKLDVIGKRYQLTRERVRQIIATAMRILRHPSNKKIIQNGLYGSRLLEEENMLRAKELSLRQRRAVLEYQEALLNDRETLFTAAHPEIIQQYARTEMEISDLDISVRSYNGLRRIGLKTVADLLNYMHDHALNEITGLGQKSCDEIRNAVQKYL